VENTPGFLEITRGISYLVISPFESTVSKAVRNRVVPPILYYTFKFHSV